MDTTEMTDEQLLAEAVKLAEEAGRLPGRNELMRTYGIGAKRAKRIIDELIRTGPSGLVDAEIAGIESAPDFTRVRSELATEPTKANPGPATEPTQANPGSTQANPGPVTEPTQANPGSTQANPGSTQANPGPVTEPAQANPGPVTEPAQANPGSTQANPGPVTEPAQASPGSTKANPGSRKPPAAWPLLVIALPAMVAIWSGWVGLGGMTGFGPMDMLPGFTRENGSPLLYINTAITLPIGIEAYAAYALKVGLSSRVPPQVRRFARISAVVSLLVGGLGQVVFHLLESRGITSAPTWVTILVACLPVACLGMGATLNHLIREHRK